MSRPPRSRYFIVLGTLLLAGSLLPVPARAGTQSNAKLALHATTLVSTPCTNSTVLSTPCSSYTTARPLNTGSYVYLVVAQADAAAGIRGLSCGLDYTGSPGVGIDPRYVAWHYCHDGNEYPSDGGNGDWPAPAGAIRLTWYTCQNTEVSPDQVHAVAGYFYVYAYSPDKFEITRNENLTYGPELQVADCAANPTNLPLSHAGYVEYGGGTGYNPCTASDPPPPTNSDAKVALHITSGPTGTSVCANPEIYVRPCSGFLTARPESTRSYVYLIVAQADPAAGIQYVSCGVDYGGSPGAGISPARTSWFGCADLEFTSDGGQGDWPAPQSGLQAIWTSCQDTEIEPDYVHAVAGAIYMYAYGPALFKITPNYNLGGSPEFRVADCSSATYDLPLSHAGFVEFEAGPGYNPCTDDPPVVGIDDPLPDPFVLLPAVPNPTYATTNVRFDLPEPAEVTIDVFAIDGSMVRELAHDSPYPAGRHELKWDGTNDHGQQTAPGVYFVHLKSGGSHESVQRIVRIGR